MMDEYILFDKKVDYVFKILFGGGKDKSILTSFFRRYIIFLRKNINVFVNFYNLLW